MITATRARVRAHKPKVKTGCVTCKSRRIKCDEERPHCRKCTNTGRPCGGYQTEVVKISKKKKPPLRFLLPDTLAPPNSVPGSTSSALCKKSTTPHAQPHQPLHLLFTDEQEYQYFRLFCDKVALQLCGYFESGIWRQLILQASEQDKAIRHAIIAIGALDKVLESAKNSTCPPISTEIGRHHQFALEQYSRAISCLRSSTAEKSSSLRTTLLTCLLIFCFENLHGNFESALVQVHSGLRLLEEWHQNLANKSPATTPKPTDSTFGIVSPAPDLIEDEIVQAFGRLDMQALSWVDRRPVSYHTVAKVCGAPSISRMPTKFASITEARIYWELVMRRLMHFICSAAHEPHAHNPPSATAPAPSSASEGGVLQRNLHPSRFIAPDAFQDQRAHLAELSRWHAAFHPLYARARAASPNPPPTPFSDSAGAIALQLRFLAAHIALSCALSRSQMIFDTYEAEFREIVVLARILLAYDRGSREGAYDSVSSSENVWNSNTNNTFTFDLGFIAQLYVVGIRCRAPRVRRSAIALLLSRPWREGVWDSVLAGRMAKVVMEIEERGCSDDGYSEDGDGGWGGDGDMDDMIVPDEARVLGTKITFEDGSGGEGGRVAVMRCFLRDTRPGTAAGAMRVVRRDIRW